jgi:chromate transporter
MKPAIASMGNHTVDGTSDLHPGLWTLFLVWVRIGLQSFGGGAATVLLIQREIIERRAWISKEEYAHYWALCQLSPGVILIAMIILIGRKLRGWSGIVVSLSGALLPSAALSCLLSALFMVIQNFSPVQAMMKGIVPATAGLMLTIALQLALPPLRQAARSTSTPLRLAECVCIIGGSFLAIAWWHVEILVVVLCAIALSLRVFSPLQKSFGKKRGEA